MLKISAYYFSLIGRLYLKYRLPQEKESSEPEQTIDFSFSKNDLPDSWKEDNKESEVINFENTDLKLIINPEEPPKAPPPPPPSKIKILTRGITTK